jgi:hypothetical protein
MAVLIESGGVMERSVGLTQHRLWIGLVLGLIVGLGLGLLIGYVVAPITWVPNADDVSVTADSYYLNNDAGLAKARLKNLPKADLERTLNELVRDNSSKGNTIQVARLTTLAQALGITIGAPALTAPVASATRPIGAPTPTAATPATPAINPVILIVLIVIVLISLGATGLIFFTRVLPEIRKPHSEDTQLSTPPSQGSGTPKAARSEAASIPPATTAPGGLGRFVPSYTFGNDNYDTSYSLETPRGEFLGECGMGISETIGEGKPDKVAAFDLWLFDKADVRTITQILMSEYAYKDQALRTKLSTKGEAVLAERGKTLRLETASLHIDAQIVELVYATQSNYPANSHFQKLIVEIVPSLKGSGTAAR